MTNVYQLTAPSLIARLVTQTFRRVVTQPDILINSKDGIRGPNTIFFVLTSSTLGLLNFNASVCGLHPEGTSRALSRPAGAIYV